MLPCGECFLKVNCSCSLLIIHSLKTLNCQRYQTGKTCCKRIAGSSAFWFRFIQLLLELLLLLNISNIEIKEFQPVNDLNDFDVWPRQDAFSNTMKPPSGRNNSSFESMALCKKSSCDSSLLCHQMLFLILDAKSIASAPCTGTCRGRKWMDGWWRTAVTFLKWI